MSSAVTLLATAYQLPEGEMVLVLAAMPAEYREALLLEHGGRESKEAKAERLGVSLASYKTMVTCARAYLRGTLSGRRR